MGMTPRPARFARPLVSAPLPQLPQRLTMREARVRCVERAGPRGGRLLIAWRTSQPRDHTALTQSFRQTFPRHGDATWRRDHVWSVPLSRKDVLAEWVSGHFAAGCELGPLPWDDAPRPAYMTEAG